MKRIYLGEILFCVLLSIFLGLSGVAPMLYSLTALVLLIAVTSHFFTQKDIKRTELFVLMLGVAIGNFRYFQTIRAPEQGGLRMEELILEILFFVVYPLLPIIAYLAVSRFKSKLQSVIHNLKLPLWSLAITPLLAYGLVILPQSIFTVLFQSIIALALSILSTLKKDATSRLGYLLYTLFFSILFVVLKAGGYGGIVGYSFEYLPGTLIDLTTILTPSLLMYLLLQDKTSILVKPKLDGGSSPAMYYNGSILVENSNNIGSALLIYKKK